MIDDNDANPFDKACSCGAIYNAVYLEAGADCLRDLLDGLFAGHFEDIDGKPSMPNKESLERDAEELSAIGLPEVAAIVAEAAERAIPEHVLECLTR